MCFFLALFSIRISIMNFFLLRPETELERSQKEGEGVVVNFLENIKAHLFTL